jgi:hypothetical protein
MNVHLRRFSNMLAAQGFRSVITLISESPWQFCKPALPSRISERDVDLIEAVLRYRVALPVYS